MFSWFIQNTYNKLLKWDEIDFEKNEKGIKKKATFIGWLNKRRLPGWKRKSESKCTSFEFNMRYGIPSVKIECYRIEKGGGEEWKTSRNMIYMCSMFISLFEINSLCSCFRINAMVCVCVSVQCAPEIPKICICSWYIHIDIKLKWLHIYDDEFFLWSYSKDENKSIHFIAYIWGK